MKQINEKLANKLWADHWAGLHHLFFKLETQQIYRDEVFYFQEFVKLKKKLSMEKLLSYVTQYLVKSSKPLWEDAKKRGVTIKRVHVVDLPLTDYLEFELLSYKISEKEGGEQIFLVTKDEAVAIGFSLDIPDTMIFDEAFAISRIYDDSGNFKHWAIPEGPEEFKKLLDMRNKLLDKAQSMDLFRKKTRGQYL